MNRALVAALIVGMLLGLGQFLIQRDVKTYGPDLCTSLEGCCPGETVSDEKGFPLCPNYATGRGFPFAVTDNGDQQLPRLVANVAIMAGGLPLLVWLGSRLVKQKRKHG